MANGTQMASITVGNGYAGYAMNYFGQNVTGWSAQTSGTVLHDFVTGRNPVEVFTNTAELLLVASNRTVGIGTGGTAPNPAYALDVHGTVNATSGFASTATIPVPPLTATGVSNTTTNIVVYMVTGIYANVTNYDCSGNPWVTNLNWTGTMEMYLQPGGAIKAGGGLSGVGHAF